MVQLLENFLFSGAALLLFKHPSHLPHFVFAGSLSERKVKPRETQKRSERKTAFSIPCLFFSALREINTNQYTGLHIRFFKQKFQFTMFAKVISQRLRCKSLMQSSAVTFYTKTIFRSFNGVSDELHHDTVFPYKATTPPLNRIKYSNNTESFFQKFFNALDVMWMSGESDVVSMSFAETPEAYIIETG
jgi:hypothetical protein